MSSGGNLVWLGLGLIGFALLAPSFKSAPPSPAPAEAHKPGAGPQFAADSPPATGYAPAAGGYPGGGYPGGYPGMNSGGMYGPQPAPDAMSAAQIAYPYYTNRGPRDFLMGYPPGSRPPSIGP